MLTCHESQAAFTKNIGVWICDTTYCGKKHYSNDEIKKKKNRQKRGDQDVRVKNNKHESVHRPALDSIWKCKMKANSLQNPTKNVQNQDLKVTRDIKKRIN